MNYKFTISIDKKELASFSLSDKDAENAADFFHLSLPSSLLPSSSWNGAYMSGIMLSIAQCPSPTTPASK
ncbi:MAG: hypothetical protein HYX22_02055 [Candidatus Yanofskybacteria bacterium]|nr:hypothetical protein [Candidatus Yanofskybacteria bacterium]